jgi:hypothetical protein
MTTTARILSLLVACVLAGCGATSLGSASAPAYPTAILVGRIPPAAASVRPTLADGSNQEAKPWERTLAGVATNGKRAHTHRGYRHVGRDDRSDQ